MIKRVDAANDWHIMDDHRNPINVMDGLLFANLTNGETSDAAYNRDFCLLYTSPSPRDGLLSRMPSSA